MFLFLSWLKTIKRSNFRNKVPLSYDNGTDDRAFINTAMQLPNTIVRGLG